VTPLKKHAMRTALNILYFTGAYRLFQRSWSGVGVIFTLHHVRPEEGGGDFSPNRILDITPEFLDKTIKQIRQSGYDIISLDEVHERMEAKNFDRKFAAFTLDDGYLDNYTQALPVFEKNNTPFTIYVCTGFPDGKVMMWWEILEQIIKDNEHLKVTVAEQAFDFVSTTTAEKYTAFNAIYWTLRNLSHEKQYSEFDKIVEQYKFDWQALCRSCSMSWDQIRELNKHPLVTIGAHTINHYALKKLTADQVREEADKGRDIITQQLGAEPKHFAYPYGDAGSAASREFDIMQELGFSTSTTTRKGMIFAEHINHLQAIPRVSLNGDFQSPHFVRLFLSGAPFALSNKFKRLIVD
jgi:peptidoglycan/xylan/chitin deacetylase (PgdA/CDA1 family)